MADASVHAEPPAYFDVTAISTRALILGSGALCLGLWGLLFAALTI